MTNRYTYRKYHDSQSVMIIIDNNRYMELIEARNTVLFSSMLWILCFSTFRSLLIVNFISICSLTLIRIRGPGESLVSQHD